MKKYDSQSLRKRAMCSFFSQQKGVQRAKKTCSPFYDAEKEVSIFIILNKSCSMSIIIYMKILLL